jgi:hypothetical protein
MGIRVVQLISNAEVLRTDRLAAHPMRWHAIRNPERARLWHQPEDGALGQGELGHARYVQRRLALENRGPEGRRAFLVSDVQDEVRGSRHRQTVRHRPGLVW